ncbi:MAG TPA: exodeoxyribonuclease V subunit alpha [Dokdonella sp.]|uniref:exodeoxyribonuclease V subunit alpha n=1 Tax=Dokdonella sp. TaxID=2291710 RepID=UPI002D80F1E3|nr:exodeoxyribonuclease V subunit alpha [Dokdonella sp.]HET9033324.1 exodeoxyribonuclease V subunit alpha [Dokdonella sp.]
MKSAAFHFRRLDSAVTIAESWRSLDCAVARWVMAHGGSALLAEVAAWASLAEGHGDSALPLTGAEADRHGMRALGDEEIESLRGEPLVGTAQSRDANEADTAFVLDDGLFYLRRNFLHEIAVARMIGERRAQSAAADQTPLATLDALFHGDANTPVQAQRDAVARMPGRRFFVLTGGPGTGKTTTVLRMLLALIRDRETRAELAPTIRISAPTGKAAQRLSETLREGAKRLREHAQQPLGDDWSASIEIALSAQASTLHRLLGSRGRRGGFAHHADNPLPVDIVVVDEASMLDLGLLRTLLEALREDTVLILIGDADQLTSVGTGSVLLDLVAAMEAAGAEDLVRLRHSFRADQSLLPINEAIRMGDRGAFDRAWNDAGDKVRNRRAGTPGELSIALGIWGGAVQTLLQRAGAFDRHPVDQMAAILAVLDALRQRQLLCALREGAFGSEAVNAILERMLSHEVDGFSAATWYPGRVVMITRNDAAAGLFNGDVGVCLRDDNDQLRVWFEVTVREDKTASTDIANDTPGLQRRAIDFEPGSLPEHKGAFAVTIHKSQGSEYDQVAVLLPPDADNRILSRQLLYTAVSRARQSVEIWGSDAVLDAALATPVRRAGGLAARFAESSHVKNKR